MLKNKYSKNSDDIFLRYLIAGISETLSDVISYDQIESDTVTNTYTVPVMLSGTGQERFLQYYFNDKNYEVCESQIEGSFDQVPRGVITYNGNSINTNNNTSPYSRGDVFEVDENGKIRMYNSNIQGIPINLTISFEVWTNSVAEQWKIWQSLIKSLYYTKQFKFIFDGCIVPCTIAFPDEIQQEKLIEFKNGADKDKMLLKTSLDIETYLPILTDKRFKGTRIKKFYTRTEVPTEEYETIETYYKGVIKGQLLYDDDLSPLQGTLTLTNANDTDNTNDLTAELDDDGYFAFHDVESRTGYILKDGDGVVIKRKIHLLPNETVDIHMELYRI